MKLSSLALTHVLALVADTSVAADKGGTETSRITQQNAVASGASGSFGVDDMVSIMSIPPGGAIITNGRIKAGVTTVGSLNEPGGTPLTATDFNGGPQTTSDVGLRYIFPDGSGETEAISWGTQAEGWGASADGESIFFNRDVGSTDSSLYNAAFSNPSDNLAESNVDMVTGPLRVNHKYEPSPDSESLFQVTVVLENTSGSTISDIRYRRTMDWDVVNAEGRNLFRDCITIQPDPSAVENLLAASSNGFQSSDPLVAFRNSNIFGIGFPAPFTDQIEDLGASFEFQFDPLDAGEQVQFKIYYGAAGSQTDAVEALASVGAEVYSLAKPTNGPASDLTCADSPVVFIFGFSGVGGDSITAAPTKTPTDEPTMDPTSEPTHEPTNAPTSPPSTPPTADPTSNPTTPAPTNAPIKQPIVQGFVTGGGYIMSPKGAYPEDGTLNGQANFGYVAKYKNGQPTGNTLFKFKAAHIKFKSTTYDSLQVDDSCATFSGYGENSGKDGYSFELTVCDNGEGSNADDDTFDIKITKTSDGSVIYDTKLGSNGPVPFAGGNAKIHKGVNGDSYESPDAGDINDNKGDQGGNRSCSANSSKKACNKGNPGCKWAGNKCMSKTSTGGKNQENIGVAEVMKEFQPDSAANGINTKVSNIMFVGFFVVVYIMF